MPKIDVELTPELLEAIKKVRGKQTLSEFIEIGMKAHMSRGKFKLNKKAVLGLR